MVGVPPFTLEQRAKATCAFADAIMVEISTLPPITNEQLDRMLRIAAAVIEAGRVDGASPDDLIPHFAMVFALVRYRPNERSGRRGRPPKESRGWFALTVAGEETWTTRERRFMARLNRQRNAGDRGPLPQSTFDMSVYDAEGLLQMLGYMSAKGTGKQTAAYAATEKPFRSHGRDGGEHPPEVRRLVDAFNRFSLRGFSEDLPKMLLHRLIAAALDTGDMDEARALAAKL
ncbi:MAG: hypothetical protein Q8O26_02865 [Phreatobacter sp.]|uniref:hypothetical protein n=1 Tax=Phreatobacter sp. TaxID=1966341 RepID=UPI002734EA67|nr:hypothetical protein [Phreatobacter sp.]MDP2800802.1 hypothetical protein [Phreatobacter sp.]